MSGHWGDVDVYAAEPLCNCGHDRKSHDDYCTRCRCGGFTPWGTE